MASDCTHAGEWYEWTGIVAERIRSCDWQDTLQTEAACTRCPVPGLERRVRELEALLQTKGRAGSE